MHCNLRPSKKIQNFKFLEMADFLHLQRKQNCIPVLLVDRISQHALRMGGSGPRGGLLLGGSALGGVWSWGGLLMGWGGYPPEFCRRPPLIFIPALADPVFLFAYVCK